MKVKIVPAGVSIAIMEECGAFKRKRIKAIHRFEWHQFKLCVTECQQLAGKFTVTEPRSGMTFGKAFDTPEAAKADAIWKLQRVGRTAFQKAIEDALAKINNLERRAVQP